MFYVLLHYYYVVLGFARGDRIGEQDWPLFGD